LISGFSPGTFISNCLRELSIIHMDFALSQLITPTEYSESHIPHIDLCNINFTSVQTKGAVLLTLKLPCNEDMLALNFQQKGLMGLT